MDNQFALRRATNADADALAQFYQKTFRETFVEDFGIAYPEKDLDFYFRSSASPESFLQNLNDPQQAMWMIEDQTNGELVAFAAVRPCDTDHIPHPDVCPKKDALLQRLYVQRNRQSYGFGRQLMNAVLPWLDENYPKRTIWLIVLSQNLKAQKFYTHYGFKKIGEFNYTIGEWKDKNFIMKRDPIPLS